MLGTRVDSVMYNSSKKVWSILFWIIHVIFEATITIPTAYVVHILISYIFFFEAERWICLSDIGWKEIFESRKTKTFSEYGVDYYNFLHVETVSYLHHLGGRTFLCSIIFVPSFTISYSTRVRTYVLTCTSRERATSENCVLNWEKWFRGGRAGPETTSSWAASRDTLSSSGCLSSLPQQQQQQQQQTASFPLELLFCFLDRPAKEVPLSSLSKWS